ncbi:putative transferase CAF17 homolog, mitochondrial [Puntigrus tetrazona]|uniref:putative transferase CAF17 homolog, mitochondrial n=1 Tax=Puntigrus tetrazona TaxID=1606681 RepID=UPI001C898A66|nr:putative transferase CAF17 homolog, mitochondrial [Puntigrus tetrazona]
MQRAILFSGAFRAIRTGSGGLRARYLHENARGIQLEIKTGDAAARFSCYSLPHRTLINVSGRDTSSFLQGIITNDVALLEEDAVRAMYAHVLNVQGRTLYDVILYSLKGNPDGFNGVLLECDSTVRDAIMRLLKVYKIRRKVEFSSCPALSVWALLPQSKAGVAERSKPEVAAADKVLVLEQDPRTELMGWRMISSCQENPHEIVSACQEGHTEEYHRHRYKIGLPEGVKDLPPGEALPLESNLVYMQGINFSKGCYLGQELTARTHHTGVIRKRLMPVTMSAPAETLEQGAALETEGGKPAGKHRAGIDTLGLSLVRLAHAKETLKLKSSDGVTVTLQATVPDWWPKNSKE